jgi:hypothetical protein
MYDAFTNVLGIYMTSTLTYTGRGFSGTQALTNATSNTSTNSTGVWYHVALTYNSTSVILYKNGVGGAPVATGSPGVTITGIRIGSQANNINPTYVGYACADCTIDDLRIYNTALTSAQVQSVYSSQGAPAPGPVMPQPQYAWDFNGTTTPYIGSATGTTTGSVSYNSAGKYGQSLIMNGSSYVKYSKTLGYNLGTGGATFAMWFKLLAVPTGNFWIFGASGTSYGDRIYILVNTSRIIGWTFIDNTLAGKVLNSPSALVVGAWTHLTFTLFNGTMTMYVNGAQVSTRSDAPMSGVVLDTQFSIAALAGGSGENINAEYDDFRIFDRALTSIQVNDIYNQQGVPGRGMVSIQTPQGISLSGAPLFNQLSPSATSSAVGAFSLRAVNGVSTRAVNVAPGGTFPPSAMTQTGTNSSTQTLGTGGKFQGSYVASSSRSDYGWGASGAFTLFTGSVGPNIWQVGNYPAGGGSLSTPTTTTTGATNYNGEWLQFQTPFPINLTGYSAFTNHLTSVVLLASTTGATSSWTLVDSKSAITVGSTITNTGLNFAGYSYFRFVVITSTQVFPLLGDVRFFGTVPSLTQDFYADERGNLLTAPVTGTTLQNWLGGATGYVTTWYDQSGRGNHAIQNTAANQPIIQRATKGPGYACLFNGTTNFLTGMSYTVLNATNFSFNIVERRTGSSSGGTASNDLTLLSCGNFGATGKLLYLIYRNNTNSLFGSWSPELYSTVTAYNSSTEPIRYTSATASSTSGRRVYIYNDPLGNPISASDATQTSLMSMTSGNFQIGYYTFGSSTSYYKGEIYELLVFTQSLYDLDGTTSINQIYQNQLGAYGT